MVLTRHAQARKCQRSIPSYVVSATYRFGKHRSVRGVAQSYTLDREAIELASESYPRSTVAMLDRYLGVYVVVGEDERIVTVARGSVRFCRH